jgi:ABC-type transport system substrate-binding protein
MTAHRRLVLPISTVVVLVVSACSTPAAATPQPTAEPAVAVTEPAASATVAPTDAPASAPAIDPWSAHAVGHRDQVGEEFTYDCPPADESRTDTVWGTDVYTDDSSVCTAAVHAGAITVEDGGEVTIEIRPGQDSYEGTERNGIETSHYGPWGGSFAVVTD